MVIGGRSAGKFEASASSVAIALASGERVHVYARDVDYGFRLLDRARELLARTGLPETGTVKVITPDDVRNGAQVKWLSS